MKRSLYHQDCIIRILTVVCYTQYIYFFS